MTVAISGGTDGIGRGDRVVAVGTDGAKAEPGVRIQRPRRSETADGPASDSAPTCLIRFPLSHGLLSHGPAGLLGRAADPVVLDSGGAGRFETAVKAIPDPQAFSHPSTTRPMPSRNRAPDVPHPLPQRVKAGQGRLEGPLPPQLQQPPLPHSLAIPAPACPDPAGQQCGTGDRDRRHR